MSLANSIKSLQFYNEDFFKEKGRQVYISQIKVRSGIEVRIGISLGLRLESGLV